MKSLEEKLAVMQLLLASIPAPVDLSDTMQRLYAHRCLFRIYALALAAKAEIDTYSDTPCPRPFLSGRPSDKSCR